MKVMKRCVAGVLALAVCATVIGGSGNIQAAAKPKLSKKSIVLKGKGTAKTLKVTKASGAKTVKAGASGADTVQAETAAEEGPPKKAIPPKEERTLDYFMEEMKKRKQTM